MPKHTYTATYAGQVFTRTTHRTYTHLVIARRSIDDAIARTNDSDFGLQAGVFTGSLDHAMRAWDRLEVGGVIVGDVPSFRVDNMPYGGIKQSGLGREGVRWAIQDMTEERLLVIRD